jgi:hypothetical protein
VRRAADSSWRASTADQIITCRDTASINTAPDATQATGFNETGSARAADADGR